MTETVIRFDHVWERFMLQGQRNSSLKQKVIELVSGRRVSDAGDAKSRANTFDALKDVSFEIHRGQIVGLVGENGSGKSTVLNLIAGIYQPDRGTVTVTGKVSALLELGTGFHPELTGRENVYLSGSLLGLNRATIDTRLPAIAEFAGIGRFIDVPVKSYSSGMYVRLAFSLAISVDADILLVDEVLSVGDHAFQQQCSRKIVEFVNQGKTILFVSHDLASVKNLCTRALLFQEGRLIRDGATRRIMDLYLQMIGRKEAKWEMAGNGFTLFFNNGRIALYHDEYLITSEGGLHTRLLGPDFEVPSYSGYWEILSSGESELVVQGSWPIGNLKQKWTISLREDHFEVSIEVTSAEAIWSRFLMQFAANSSYTRWADVLENGSFPSVFPDDVHPLSVSGHVINAGIVHLSGEDLAPPIVFEAMNGDSRPILSLMSNEFTHSGRLVSFSGSTVQPGEVERKDPAGGFRYRTGFRCSVGLGETKLRKAKEAQLRQISLSSESFSVLFNGSHFHLLESQRCLTGLLGIYLSFKSRGTWHDSSQAWWKIEQFEGGLRGECRQKRIPLSQIWEFSFITPKILDWKVDLVVHESIPLSRIQVNLMFSENYTLWRNAEHREGSFPDSFKDDFGGDWETLSSHSATRGPITVIPSDNGATSYPAVAFSLLQPSESFQANIVNSDSYFRGRVLQFLRILSPGKELFLPGKILLAHTHITNCSPTAGKES